MSCSLVMALPLYLATSFRGGAGVGAVLPSTYGRASQWGV